jgi:hypothetical protein
MARKDADQLGVGFAVDRRRGHGDFELSVPKAEHSALSSSRLDPYFNPHAVLGTPGMASHGAHFTVLGSRA